MKKKTFKTMVAAVCVVAASMGGMKAYNAASQTDANMLLAENVEALADVEPGHGYCYNSITSQNGSLVLYCPTCTYLPGTSSCFSGTGNCP